MASLSYSVFTDDIPTFLIAVSGKVREIIGIMLLNLYKVENNLDTVRNY